MNCYNHSDRPAVATCLDCGKGLCAECASAYTVSVCRTCSQKRVYAQRSEIVIEFALTFGIGLLLGIPLARAMNDEVLGLFPYVAFTYIFSGIVPGWKTLTRITPAVFLILPIFGWVIFLLLKLFLSLCVGLVALPVRTFINIRRW